MEMNRKLTHDEKVTLALKDLLDDLPDIKLKGLTIELLKAVCQNDEYKMVQIIEKTQNI